MLIVNHALLLADAASENHILPEYKHVVLDEAHHLEEATTNGMSFRVEEIMLYRRMRIWVAANAACWVICCAG